MLYSNAKVIILFILPLLLWLGLIFYLSSLSDLRIEALGFWDLVLRKFAHAAEFAVLCFLLIRTFKLKFSVKKSVVISMIISILYAASDELHQYYVPGRVGSVWDVLVDTWGIFLMAMIWIKNKYEIRISRPTSLRRSR